MGDLVAGGARVAGDDMAVMAHFFADRTFLRLGQWAEREQHCENTDYSFHDILLVIVAGAMPEPLFQRQASVRLEPSCRQG
jgi:hypothetical protein